MPRSRTITEGPTWVWISISISPLLRLQSGLSVCRGSWAQEGERPGGGLCISDPKFLKQWQQNLISSAQVNFKRSPSKNGQGVTDIAFLLLSTKRAFPTFSLRRGRPSILQVKNNDAPTCSGHFPALFWVRWSPACCYPCVTLPRIVYWHQKAGATLSTVTLFWVREDQLCPSLLSFFCSLTPLLHPL